MPDLHFDAFLTVAGIDSALILFFAFLFLDKAHDEAMIVRASDRLTAATSRTTLGWALRMKGLSLAWLIGTLGMIFLVRGGYQVINILVVEHWSEPRWVALTFRVIAVFFLVWNKLWRMRTRHALDVRLAESLEGTPQPTILAPSRYTDH